MTIREEIAELLAPFFLATDVEDYKKYNISLFEDLIESESLARSKVDRLDSYVEALDDMFLEIAKLADPDEGQFNPGNLETNMDDIHEIRIRLTDKKKLDAASEAISKEK